MLFRSAVPPRAALGQRSNPLFSTPPESPLFSDSGGEVGRGGYFATEWRVWRLVVRQIFLGTKREFRKSARYCPITLALSPNTENVLGERVERVGTLTQGGARGDGGPGAPASRLPWATIRRPARGSMRKKRPPAASQMSNLKSEMEMGLG